MGQDFFTNSDESLPHPTEFMYGDYARTKCEAEKMVLEADQTVLENGTEQDLFSALLTWEGGGIISRLRKHYYFEVIVHRHDDCITSILYEHKMTLVCLKTSPETLTPVESMEGFLVKFCPKNPLYSLPIELVMHIIFC